MLDKNSIRESLQSIKEAVAAIELALIEAPEPAVSTTATVMKPAQFREGTPANSGLSCQDVTHIVLRAIKAHGGEAQMRDLYDPIESNMKARGWTFSFGGRASARRLVNETAVANGYIEQYDPRFPGWRITPRGEAFLAG